MRIPEDKLDEILECCEERAGTEGEGLVWMGFAHIIHELQEARSPKNAANQVAALATEALLDDEPAVKQYYLVKILDLTGHDYPEDLVNMGAPPEKTEKEKVQDAKIATPFSNIWRR